MTTSPGTDCPEPVVDVAGPPEERTDEPVGYNLASSLSYEQPPRRPLSASAVPSGPLPTRQATTGLVLGLVGVVSVPFLPVAVPLGIATIVVSLAALYRCRAGLAAGRRRRAIVGVSLGILGVILGMAALVWWFFVDGLSGA